MLTTVLSLIGGPALLLYGLYRVSEGLQNVVGPRVRSLLHLVTENRVLGAGAGALFTALIQSSSATTVMLVGFTSAGLLTLNQSIALILGADLGTTLTVQLIAFEVFEYALLIVAAGFVLFFFGRRRRVKSAGEAILGFGLVFLGIQVLIHGVKPLAENEAARSLLLNLADYPVLAIAGAAVLTAAMNSSAAMLGIAVAFASQGLISLNGALPLVLGANVGTCAPALISSVGAVAEARRVAIAHCLFKVIGVLLFFPFLGWLAPGVEATGASLVRQIANAHTFFNLALLALFLPLARPFARLITRLIPEPPQVEGYAKPKYLDPHVLDSPPLAMAQASRETLRMADLVQEMLRDTIQVFVNGDPELLESIEQREDWVDTLNREIKLYVTRMSEQALTQEQFKREMAVLATANDLENIGDIIDRNLMELAKKKIYKGLRFSDQGQKEIIELHAAVTANLGRVISAFASQDVEVARQVIAEKARINQKERELKQAHVHRLHSGLPESIETSAIHLDVLTNLKRVNSHVTNIAYPIAEPV